MIFNRFDSLFTVRNYRDEPLTLELQLRDTAGFVEKLDGRLFRLRARDINGVLVDGCDVACTIGTDAEGQYVSGTLDDGRMALVAAVVEPRYELVETLINGEDPHLTGLIEFEQRFGSPALQSPTVAAGVVGRFTRTIERSVVRVALVQRGSKGFTPEERLAFTRDPATGQPWIEDASVAAMAAWQRKPAEDAATQASDDVAALTLEVGQAFADKALAIDALLDGLVTSGIEGGGLLESTGTIGDDLRLSVTAATLDETITGVRTDVAVVPEGAKALTDAAVGALATLTGSALDKRIRVDTKQALGDGEKTQARANLETLQVRSAANVAVNALAAPIATAAGTTAAQAADYALLTYLFNTPGVSPIVLDRQRYDVGPNTVAFSVSGTEVWGSPGGTTITTSAKVLFDLRSISNVHFYDIAHETTAVSTEEDATNALIRSLHRATAYVTWTRCTFAALTANINAIKFVCDIDGEFAKWIKWIDCHVLGAGRMAVELSNHPNTLLNPATGQKYPNDTVSRFTDVLWSGGSLRNLGLVSPLYGMGFSVTGFADRVRLLDVLIDNAMNCGVEFVGACTSLVRATVTNMRDVPVTQSNPNPTPSAAFSFTKNPELSIARRMTNNVLENCVTDDTCREIRFWYQIGLRTRGCYFRVTGAAQARGYVSTAGCDDWISNGDTFDCDGAYVIYGKSDIAHGGGTTNCVWQNFTIIHSRAVNPFYLFCFYGSRTTNNQPVWEGSKYTPKTASEPLIGSQTEGSFTGYINGTTLVVTATGTATNTLFFEGATIDSDRLLAGTTITKLDGTGTGGIGTYTVNFAQTVASHTMKAGRATFNFGRGIPRSTAGYDLAVGVISYPGDYNTDMSLEDSIPDWLSAPSTQINAKNTTPAVVLTAKRTMRVPKGMPTKYWTNNVPGGQAIDLLQVGTQTPVTIPFGATVKIASTPAGLVIVP